MIEVLSKFGGLFKAQSLPLFLLMFTSTKRFGIKEKLFRIEDEVPGDNFPYAVMSQNY